MKATNSTLAVDAMEVERWAGGVDSDQERCLRSMTGEYLDHEDSIRHIGDLELRSISIPPITGGRARFFVLIFLSNGKNTILIKALVDTGLMGCFNHSKIFNSNKLNSSPLSSPFFVLVLMELQEIML